MTALVMGLGKLGLPMAVHLAHYTKTYGWDINQQYMGSLVRREFESPEPNCDYSCVHMIDRLETLREVIKDVDFVSLCVNTPLTQAGTMDLGQVIDACHLLNGYARVRSEKLPVVINSTVMPGTAEQIANRFITLHPISNPVWIAVGSVLRDLRTPPGCVIGCDCDNTGPCFHNTLKSIVQGASAPLVTNTRTAEAIKLFHNFWCTAKMSSINWFGDHATELGIDINAVSWFMQNGGERPGQFWRYGPPFSGPCFPRDLQFYQQFNPHDKIARAVDTINRSRMSGIIDQIKQALPHTQTPIVAILGRSYKHGVPVDEASFGVDLSRYLTDYHGCEVFCINSIDELTQDQIRSVEVWVLNHEQLWDHIPKSAKAVIDLWRQPK